MDQKQIKKDKRKNCNKKFKSKIAKYQIYQIMK